MEDNKKIQGWAALKLTQSFKDFIRYQVLSIFLLCYVHSLCHFPWSLPADMTVYRHCLCLCLLCKPFSRSLQHISPFPFIGQICATCVSYSSHHQGEQTNLDQSGLTAGAGERITSSAIKLCPQEEEGSGCYLGTKQWVPVMLFLCVLPSISQTLIWEHCCLRRCQQMVCNKNGVHQLMIRQVWEGLYAI